MYPIVWPRQLTHPPSVRSLRLLNALPRYAYSMSFATAGLHHVTAIATRPQANIEFYVRLVGLRLVKRTVNYDDPQTYHFYFGDPLGRPGTVISFFAWPGSGPAVRGAGEATAVAFRVPEGALAPWRARLSQHRLQYENFERFGEEVVAFSDPDGTPLELVETDLGGVAPDTWPDAPLPAALAVQGLHAVTITAPDLDKTSDLLERTLGLKVVAEEVDRPQDGGLSTGRRMRLSAGPNFVDLLEVPRPLQGRWGAGSLHHVALRAEGAEQQQEAREQLIAAGVLAGSVKDRLYFKSSYFTEPGGAIIEVATDGPGFTFDEEATELGLAFKLPEWLESEREFLRSRLPVTASPEYADRYNS